MRPRIRDRCSSALAGACIACAVGLASAGAADDLESRALRWGPDPRAPPGRHAGRGPRARRAGDDGRTGARPPQCGEPARRALLRVAREDDAVAAREPRGSCISQAEEDLVEATSLASSIPGLLARGAAATNYTPTRSPPWTRRTGGDSRGGRPARARTACAGRDASWRGSLGGRTRTLRFRGRDRSSSRAPRVCPLGLADTVGALVRWPPRTSPSTS